MKIKTAEFVKSATAPKDYPEPILPEIAFAGRSNVGKSSLINSLTGRKKLVKVSNTPGRTQLLNFFCINDALSFVDLPGYGYAKVSKKERKEFAKMIETYLEVRDSLLSVICIFDARRGMEEDDKLLLQAAPYYGWQPIIVFTKADKFKTNALYNRKKELAKQTGCKPSELLMYSSETGLGREDLWSRIVEITSLGEDEPEPAQDDV